MQINPLIYDDSKEAIIDRINFIAALLGVVIDKSKSEQEQIAYLEEASKLSWLGISASAIKERIEGINS